LSQIVINSETLAGIVRSRRKELGLIQVELAELSGVSARFIFDIENGKKTLSMKHVLKVVTTLGLVMTLQLRSVSP
jgi:HTH-type transcriptional regulator / antitoxin HipB